MQARVTGWKWIETTAAQQNPELRPEMIKGTCEVTHAYIAGTALISYSRSHIPLPDVLYKRWWVCCIPYEYHSWMSTYYAWPGRNRVCCQSQVVEVDENNIGQRRTAVKIKTGNELWRKITKIFLSNLQPFSDWHSCPSVWFIWALKKCCTAAFRCTNLRGGQQQQQKPCFWKVLYIMITMNQTRRGFNNALSPCLFES